MTQATSTDMDIRNDVEAELLWNPRIVHPNAIGVAVQNGVVTLTGQVSTYVEKMAVESAAFRVSQVKAVADDIAIVLPTMGERTDTDLATAVLTTLKWDAIVPTDTLEVVVTKGWVTLKGEVEWQFQRSAAQSACYRLAGVKGVSNLLTVKPHAVPADIKQQIHKALLRNAETDANAISVEVHDATASLRGSVRTLAEKQEAEAVAWSARGITAVENHITVY